LMEVDRSMFQEKMQIIPKDTPNMLKQL